MKNHEEGFTLVEVLVAFAIMAGAIIMAFGVFGDGLRGLRLAQTRSQQIQAAQYQIDRVSTEAAISEGTTHIVDKHGKLRLVIQRLSGLEGEQKFSKVPFKIAVFSDDVKSSEAPILETIILAHPLRP